ncbi:malate synthase A [Roseivirga sp. BDSF3-8]|uniref:malate synthase A n=1 Tax=Roseivirga sp. BDSF3-8 TaxID=3241598 RepID=UPI003531D544
MSTTALDHKVNVKGELKPGFEGILTADALAFISHLHETFNKKRLALLEARNEKEKAIANGQMPDFPSETADVRAGNWHVADIPEPLQDRRTEITGPVDRRMVINALNSGAKVFMADFEDANSPTWENCVNGQINLRDAIRREVDFEASNGKFYSLKEEVATLKVRPRGWHLVEKHVLVDGEPISASIFDFGLFFFHNAKELINRGAGPYFYLPKLESYLEARLWNEVFIEAQKQLDIPNGTIKATVLIETILAAFEMEEIIYELRDHMAGLNAGRWDYIFSVIKKFRDFPDFVLPDRGQVTMTVPFMKSYAQQLVKVCHKRGAHAIGGMSAFIPSRRDEEVNRNAFEKVREDKRLEAEHGFDGTWVAHPDLVPVAMEEFNKKLTDKPHQKDRQRDDLNISAKDLLNTSIEGGKITETGLRQNVNVAILYIGSWLQGTGAAALYNLMEDAATAEISRAQVWQWLHNEGITLDDGRPVDTDLYRQVLIEEKESIRSMVGEDAYKAGRYEEAAALFDDLVTDKQFVSFLTLPAYEKLA